MKALTGNEHFYFDDMPTPHLLLDFWAWSSSDLLKGTLRGSLAEFIVATAIGEDITQMHEDRLPYDLEMPRGGETCKIEVKSSSYINAEANIYRAYDDAEKDTYKYGNHVRFVEALH